MTRRVFVTGATSRQANPDKNGRDVMVSWLISEVCRDLGYQVEHGSPSIERDLAEFDHVFCGLAPIHGLGASRIYGALATFIRASSEGKLTLYLDDPDVSKIVNGARTMLTSEERFTKPFFVYRKEYDTAVRPEWRSWLLQGVRHLAEYDWPPILVPSFTWGDADQLLRQVPRPGSAHLVDFTSYLPSYAPSGPLRRAEEWVTETSNDRWLLRQRPRWRLQRYGKDWDRRPADQALVEAYSRAEGVLDPGEPHGWWTSRLGYAAQARAIYSTNWQYVSALGESFTRLVDSIEQLSPSERRTLAEHQYAAFSERSWSRDEVKNAVCRLVEGT